MTHHLQVHFFRTVAHWLFAREQELELKEMITVVGQMDAEAECWRIINEAKKEIEMKVKLVVTK